MGSEQPLKYRDNQAVLNTWYGCVIMSLNWNWSAESTCFSADLFSCQCGIRASGTTRVRVFLGESEMEEKGGKRVNFLKVHRYSMI